MHTPRQISSLAKPERRGNISRIGSWQRRHEALSLGKGYARRLRTVGLIVGGLAAQHARMSRLFPNKSQ